jgi:5-formyltetrahydrofolate cyclo-ligase
MEEKHHLRKFWKSKRKEITPADLHSWNAAIVAHITHHLQNLEKSRVHLFLPIRSNQEVDLQSLLTLDHSFYSSISEHDSPRMTTVSINQNTSLQVDKWGIPTPINASGYTGELDLIFVPLLAVDQKGHRLGYGKGYYDRFLAEHPKAQKVGVHWFPPIPELPTDQYDIALNAYIYPEGIIHFPV